jgi:hypothetical protein
VVVLEDGSEQVRQVLVGRDLSAGGVGVEPHPSLALGDPLRLAIFDTSFRVPFTVKAEVIRDDGQRGLGLRFAKPEAETSQRIGKLVSTLLASEASAPARPPF